MSLIATEEKKPAPTASQGRGAPPADERRGRSGPSPAIFGAFAVLISLAALIGAALAIDESRDSEVPATVAVPASQLPEGYVRVSAPAPAADSAAAAGVEFEPFRRVDPELPAVPPGPVKRFRVDVLEHVTKVHSDLAPTRVWSYAVNGTVYRGTGASPPIVVEQGDRVEMTLVNGGSEAMDVRMPHSIDFHSSEVAPDRAFKTIMPGEEHTFRFTAEHPGVFMYHCATQPVLLHTGAGMVGMMVVKPRDLAPVDRELFVTQQEFYIGEPGGDASLEKMEAKNPDVIAFNGYASQYQDHPISVRRGERIRMYVLNAGPSEWSAFHVIGTVFDRAVVENTVFPHSQTVNLAPSQGGWVEFDLAQEGSYPFVTHGFGDMVKGAVGVLTTEGAGDNPAGHSH